MPQPLEYSLLAATIRDDWQRGFSLYNEAIPITRVKVVDPVNSSTLLIMLNELVVSTRSECKKQGSHGQFSCNIGRVFDALSTVAER